MMWTYSLLIVAGLAATAWGLVASHRLSSPWGIAAALAVPVGVAVAVLGILLLVIPDFFKG